MQVILDSLFARLGSAPIWGRKKGEYRDWTRRADSSKMATLKRARRAEAFYRNLERDVLLKAEKICKSIREKMD